KQLIQKYGYPFENHTVLTDDGYILEVHRIPYGRNISIKDANRPPVLLFPALLCGSVEWVNMGTEKSFGFILADQGYDVWLANPRGTTWSRKHIRLDPDRNKKKFWNFSFHEIGSYDLPAFIDHILNVTNHKTLYYVGHSQGTTAFFILASMKPEYNHKVRLSVAYCPAAYIAHARVLYDTAVTDFWKNLEVIIRTSELHEILPHSPLFGLLAQIFCNDYSPLQHVCVEVFYLAAGRSDNQFNKSLIPVIASNIPAGASVKQFNHYLQLYLAKVFQQYDYGEKVNLNKYNQSRPPKYDLSKVIAPHLFYHGSNDILFDAEDVDKLASELPNVLVYRRISGFNHLDPVWGIDAVNVIFNEVLEFMKQFGN
ncbi:hypothetical protein ILUMI_18278, partial [Ignelater luminosus]